MLAQHVFNRVQFPWESHDLTGGDEGNHKISFYIVKRLGQNCIGTI